MKEFLAKGLSGRKIELDEVIEPEQGYTMPSHRR
jgi:hypothetical protein